MKKGGGVKKNEVRGGGDGRIGSERGGEVEREWRRVTTELEQ